MPSTSTRSRAASISPAGRSQRRRISLAAKRIAGLAIAGTMPPATIRASTSPRGRPELAIASPSVLETTPVIASATRVSRTAEAAGRSLSGNSRSAGG